MGNARSTAAAAVLLVEAGLAVLGVLVHYSFISEYGDITGSAVEAWSSGFSSGLAAVAVGLVAVAALIAVSASGRRRVRLAAVAIPVLMVVGMLAVTPAALRNKLVNQYDDTPQCVSAADAGLGPGSDAERESQQAFESIEHVGHFGGGGTSGVDGCDRPLVLTEDVDVLQHYRAALPRAGWRVVKDDTRQIRAEREGMAFEVSVCEVGGIVWAGTTVSGGGARCEPVA